MLERVLAAVSDIPVIVQGVLGSALFALMLYAGQRASSIAKRTFASHSRAQRKAFLIEERIKYNILDTQDFAERSAFVSLLVYRAVRSLFKALIWLTLGFVGSSFLEVLGIVGYLGALYYLFAGLGTVASPERVPDTSAKLKEINAEIERLDEA